MSDAETTINAIVDETRQRLIDEFEGGNRAIGLSALSLILQRDALKETRAIADHLAGITPLMVSEVSDPTVAQAPALAAGALAPPAAAQPHARFSVTLDPSTSQALQGQVAAALAKAAQQQTQGFADQLGEIRSDIASLREQRTNDIIAVSRESAVHGEQINRLEAASVALRGEIGETFAAQARALEENDGELRGELLAVRDAVAALNERIDRVTVVVAGLVQRLADARAETFIDVAKHAAEMSGMREGLAAALAVAEAARAQAEIARTEAEAVRTKEAADVGQAAADAARAEGAAEAAQAKAEAAKDAAESHQTRRGGEPPRPRGRTRPQH
jgi:hypothetical protein